MCRKGLYVRIPHGAQRRYGDSSSRPSHRGWGGDHHQRHTEQTAPRPPPRTALYLFIGRSRNYVALHSSQIKIMSFYYLGEKDLRHYIRALRCNHACSVAVSGGGEHTCPIATSSPERIILGRLRWVKAAVIKRSRREEKDKKRGDAGETHTLG